MAEYDHEFVAAHADDHVGVAHARSQACADFLQQFIARFVTARVVDVLEAVEVQKHDTQHGACRLGLRDRLRQEARQVVPIRQSGQLIVMRHPVEPLLIVDELLFRLAPYRYIVRDVRERFPAIDIQRVAADLDFHERSALAALLHVQRHVRVGIAQPCKDVLRRRIAVRKDLRQRQCRCFLAGIAESRQKGGIAVLHLVRRRIDDDDGIVRLIDDGFVAGIDGTALAEIAPQRIRRAAGKNGDA